MGKKLIFLSVILAIAWLLVPRGNADSDALVISAFEGDVSCFKATLNKWVPAEEGLELETGDSVKTGKDSFCDAAVGEASFRVKENSLLTVSEILKNIELKIEYGTILTKIKKLPPESRFVVKTPQAVIGSRGTRYKVYVEERPGRTYTSVLEESVICQGLGEPERSLIVEQYKRTEISPWKTAVIRAKGTGILSEKILGEVALKKLKSEISLKSFGGTKEEALRNLSEKILAIQIDRDTCIGDILALDTELLKNVYHYIVESAVISAAAENGMKAEILLDPISKMINRDIFVISSLIAPLSEEEYTKKFGAEARVTTKRAATVDGYRKLAEIIYGTVIDSKTTLQDYVVTSDVIKTRVTGIVQGAQEVGTEYFLDGSIAVTLETEARRIKDDLSELTGDVFGTHYIAMPAIIFVDDFEEYLAE